MAKFYHIPGVGDFVDPENGDFYHLPGGGDFQEATAVADVSKVIHVSSALEYQAAGTTITFDQEVISGDNRLLLVAVWGGNSGSVQATGVTYGGVSMTLHGSFDSNHARLYKLVAPAVGIGSVVVTLDESGDAQAQSATFFNADQTTPLDALFSGYSSTGPAAVVSAANDMVFLAVGDESGKSDATSTFTQRPLQQSRDGVLYLGAHVGEGAATVDMTYGGTSNSPRYFGANINLAAGGSAALTGTATASIDEADIVAGGKTIILTLTGDTWAAAGTGPIGSTADTQALIDGLNSAQVEATGWNAEVRDKEVTTAVVRTSATVATITLTAQAAYDITAQETITATIPAATLVTSASDIVASPTFTVSHVAAGGFQAAWARNSNQIIGAGA